ncbi:type II toxin-antitoxin system Phd/YefM family antitoxin [Limnohabitans sp. JirII-31]|uniref:type II toxin-antitoxin system Phd/YefM family antitoxin n=1 Tax=Limnohabitans sp. JirII-31 TaxID=1977908 RepID=UPI000C1DC96A|nr:prevent-host-death protein [Limnohabitans sp. JirII-31]PIT80762.1 hypothetical protein B9Z41_02325 [Limnohabitans sp. JirII-31]
MPIQSVGSYEAKTHLPRLLREVQAGKVFEISVRGQVVARLAPATFDGQSQAAVAKMREFMQAQQASGAGAGLDLRELIDEGRA